MGKLASRLEKIEYSRSAARGLHSSCKVLTSAHVCSKVTRSLGHRYRTGTKFSSHSARSSIATIHCSLPTNHCTDKQQTLSASMAGQAVMCERELISKLASFYPGLFCIGYWRDCAESQHTRRAYRTARKNHSQGEHCEESRANLIFTKDAKQVT